MSVFARLMLEVFLTNMRLEGWQGQRGRAGSKIQGYWTEKESVKTLYTPRRHLGPICGRRVMLNEGGSELIRILVRSVTSIIRMWHPSASDNWYRCRISRG